ALIQLLNPHKPKALPVSRLISTIKSSSTLFSQPQRRVLVPIGLKAVEILLNNGSLTEAARVMEAMQSALAAELGICKAPFDEGKTSEESLLHNQSALVVVLDHSQRTSSSLGNAVDNQITAAAKGRAIRDLRDLDPEIEEEGLDDGAGDGEAARVCADEGTREGYEEAEDDGEEGDVAIGDEAGVEGGEEHAEDADEGEEADDEGGVGVRRGREEESEGGPEIGEGGAGAEADEAGLDEEGVVDEDGEDGPEDVRVGG
ncbi:MAG: hypothetical protein Q9184_008283, partial [Pyrenodesmia sp. 2 TL-2023]